MSENTSSSQAETCHPLVLLCWRASALHSHHLEVSLCSTHKETDYGTEQNVAPAVLPAFTIFIKCPSGNFALVVNGSSSIQDILEILRQKVSGRQDACGIFSSPFHLYMPGRWLPLSAMEMLDALNVSDLSTLHFRSLLLGGASPVDPVDLTFALDDSSDHCEYQRCKNHKANGDPYKFQPGEEKFQMKACLRKDGPATKLHHSCKTSIEERWSGVILVKKAKAKGAAPESRLPVAISSLLNKNALKTGYSPAHYLYNSEKDKFRKTHGRRSRRTCAKVFVQVKRENGTKKGISFHPACLVQAHHKVKGFKFTTDDFFVVDSGWIPVLEGDLMQPTELFYKGITKGLSRRAHQFGGLKYSQGAPENWYMSSPVKNGKGKKRKEPELDSDANSEWSCSSKWAFDAIPDIITTGGTYLESSFNPVTGTTFMLTGWRAKKEQRLGSGSFKMAHFGLLNVGMNLEGVDVPAAMQGKVCIKWLYFGLTTRQGVQWMTDDVECMAILQEAKYFGLGKCHS
ncbi:uncharacterized protein EV420DRAFT_1485616 [Desarmillaria tabescens]|uniref:Uncharacterized protein n=1 Tax=Armillaria tabescens TaxID=1929756 RepID=A0AA39MPS9_ARMTA|nr:uncharacterized protein EV420DRAFT_1485616 [Desarmillaria tabescens]KAK0441544.1 hypothetical protein EV420DRAFT_1485616 [Desarmillaria tabescens]